jgi:hypothetical protein
MDCLNLNDVHTVLLVYVLVVTQNGCLFKVSFDFSLTCTLLDTSRTT